MNPIFEAYAARVSGAEAPHETRLREQFERLFPGRCYHCTLAKSPPFSAPRPHRCPNQEE